MLGDKLEIKSYGFSVQILDDISAIETDSVSYKRVGEVEAVVVKNKDTTLEESVKLVEDCRDALERLGNPL